MSAGGRSLKDAYQYLPYVHVSHQRNITTLYLYYIDYKIVNNTNASLKTIVDTVKKSYDKLPVDIKDEYSQLVTEVKALWLQKKNRGEIKPSGGGGSGSSAGGGDSLSGKGGGAMRQNNLAAQAVDDVGNRARKLMEARAVRFNGFLSEGATAIMNDVIIFADVVALINEPMPSRDDWLVSEVSLTSYSIKRGVVDTYHVFVDPGKVWLGYRAQFNEHNEMHHIPEFFSQAVPQSKLDEVYQQISQFVRSSIKIKDPNVLASGIIPIVCRRDGIEKVDYALNEFVRESYLQMTQVSPREVFKFEAFGLDECLMAIYTHSLMLPTTNIDEIASLAESASRKTQFDNMPHLLCVYHDDTEAQVCALSNVKKMCYSTSSALKCAFEFQLTPNHMPEQAIQTAPLARASEPNTANMRQGIHQDHESMLAAGGGSDFRGAPQGGVASTVGGFSQFGGSASQFSSNYHSQTAASNFSANPQQQYYPQGAKPNRYQHPRSPASTVSASTFVTKDIPRQWGPAGGAQWEGYRESANAYRPFEADDDSGSTVSFYTSRTGTAITSSGGIVKPRFRGQPQVKPPPGPPGVNATGTGRDGIMDDNDDYNDDLSSMASMGRGRGRGRGYRVPNQI